MSNVVIKRAILPSADYGVHPAAGPAPFPFKPLLEAGRAQILEIDEALWFR